MISQAEKLLLLQGFLSQGYYCDMELPREEEDIQTLKDTVDQYIQWGSANIENPSDDFIAAVQTGMKLSAECQNTINSSNYSDLSTIQALIDQLSVDVDKLVVG